MGRAELRIAVEPLGAAAIDEELCPTCLNPSLVRLYYTMAPVGAPGVPDVLTWIVCPDCEVPPS